MNAGIRNASGLYFKVVDSDDWVDKDSLMEILNLLKNILEDGVRLDMLISNYVYEKPSLKKHKVINYRSAIPRDQIFHWSDVKHFKLSQNILMHSVIYRTKLLRDCNLQLPKHTFYVDNIFVYQPLPCVKNMYYLDVDFYRYYIGRDDQSVNEEMMMKRIDQQIHVTKFMIESHDLCKIPNKKLKSYMLKYLTMIMTVTSVYLVKEGTEESLAKRAELWQFLNHHNKHMSRLVNHWSLTVDVAKSVTGYFEF